MESTPIVYKWGRYAAAVVAASRSRNSILFRLICLAVALPTGAIWFIGCWLNPNYGPLGIERQLGTSRCGFYTRYGIPCPTCGWTTAVSHLYHGQMIQAFMTQPAGAIFGLLILGLFSLSLGGVLVGRWLGPSLPWLWFRRYRLIGWTLLILAVSWGYKIWAVHCWPSTMQ
ncbi:MAG: DUF2752 domain-containing protein [Phycisphaerae bacterium]